MNINISLTNLTIDELDSMSLSVLSTLPISRSNVIKATHRKKKTFPLIRSNLPCSIKNALVPVVTKCITKVPVTEINIVKKYAFPPTSSKLVWGNASSQKKKTSPVASSSNSSCYVKNALIPVVTKCKK